MGSYYDTQIDVGAPTPYQQKQQQPPLPGGKKTKFNIINSFGGYQNLQDQTNLDPGILVVGSQNVLLNLGERVAARQGYTLDGQSNPTVSGILSDYDWETHLGTIRHLRSWGTNLEYRYVDSMGVITWNLLATIDPANFNYAEYWLSSEQKDVLLFVNGSSNIFEWSGAITTFASATVNTITKQGITTFAEEGFLLAGSILTVASVPTAGGAGYTVGDSLTISPAVQGGTVIVTSVDGGGAVLTVQRDDPGISYTTGAGQATTGGTGAGATIDITSVTVGTVIIGGITYSYTGGVTTTTLTGVTPDPTLGGHVAGDVIVQGVLTIPNSAIVGLPTDFENDLIATFQNQIYIGSFINREVYVSEDNDFTDFTFNNPRVPGDGAILTFDATPVGFAVQEDAIYTTAGLDQWYKTTFTLSADLMSEDLSVTRIKTNAQGAAQEQMLIGKIKNDAVFVTNEPSLDTLGRLNLINIPQSVNLSNPIKNDFDFYNFTGGHVFYYRNFIYIAIPENSRVLIYNLIKQFWEPPQIMPISRFAIIDGLLYGHSSEQPETYKLFTGFNDNGKPIDCRALFSYQQFGDRANQKNMTEFYNEGYIQANTTLNLTLLYNYVGCEGSVSETISGRDPTAVCALTDDGSLGKHSLGKRSLAGRGDTIDETLPPKYRIIKTFPQTDFYELQVQYSTDDVDQRWELLAFGGNVMMSTSENNAITE